MLLYAHKLNESTNRLFCYKYVVTVFFAVNNNKVYAKQSRFNSLK